MSRCFQHENWGAHAEITLNKVALPACACLGLLCSADRGQWPGLLMGCFQFNRNIPAITGIGRSEAAATTTACSSPASRSICSRRHRGKQTQLDSTCDSLRGDERRGHLSPESWRRRRKFAWCGMERAVPQPRKLFLKMPRTRGRTEHPPLPHSGSGSARPLKALKDKSG